MGKKQSVRLSTDIDGLDDILLGGLVPGRAYLVRGGPGTGKTLALVKIEPLQYTVDEFTYHLREEVEENRARMVMIDSVAGYRLCIRGGDLVQYVHAMCKYLQNSGVATLLLDESETIAGELRATRFGISYVTDSILILRYVEMGGQMHRLISLLKKRLSDFDKSLREFEITRFGIKVGEPLTNMRAIITGLPELVEQPRKE
jgi:circadian clock protein KaiC